MSVCEIQMLTSILDSIVNLSKVGACRALGLVTTLTAVEVVPFLVIAIGLDNMTAITKAVVSTSPDMAVRFRVAEVISFPLCHNTKSVGSGASE